MIDNSNYTPISCAQHDVYESAIVQGKKLRLSVSLQNKSDYVQVVRPIDLKTQDAQEFLIAITETGEKVSVRLDHIFNCITL